MSRAEGLLLPAVPRAASAGESQSAHTAPGTSEGPGAEGRSLARRAPPRAAPLPAPRRPPVAMDWGNVTTDELLDALREAEWNTRPRPLVECFAKFAPPTTASKLVSRLKCNAYFYRTNYVMLLVACFVFAFVRNPLALLACALLVLGALLCNDSFAQALSDRVTRAVRKAYPPAAAWMRRNQSASSAPGGRPYAGRARTVLVCGFPRKAVVAGVAGVGVFLAWTTRAASTVMWTLVTDVVLTLLHASLRVPNLKARISSYREEFRAVWRGYSEA